MVAIEADPIDSAKQPPEARAPAPDVTLVRGERAHRHERERATEEARPRQLGVERGAKGVVALEVEERAVRPRQDMHCRCDSAQRHLVAGLDDLAADPPLSSITDEFHALPEGGFLVTLMGGQAGHAPGRVAEFDKGCLITRSTASKLAVQKRAYRHQLPDRRRSGL